MADGAFPLVSFALFAFNQEAYIRQATVAALAQTYSPLQIVLSDDCSSDRTFEIICDEVQRYSGAHKVETYRNPRTLGFAAHFNEVMEKCQGELVVIAAGDDISFPQRTAELFGAWDREGRKVVSVFSGCKLIDATGIVTGVMTYFNGYHRATPVMRIYGGVPVAGATHAFNRRIYSDFGPLREDTANEDVVLQFRASLREGVFVLSSPLVSYRRHTSNASNVEARFIDTLGKDVACQVEIVHLERHLNCLANFSNDIGIAIGRGWVSDNYGNELLRLVRKEIKLTTARHAFLSHRHLEVLKAVALLARSEASVLTIARDILIRFFPRLIGLGRNIKGRWRNLMASN